MLVDGLIGGVGSVLTFLPILVIFFAAFALLEDMGYMARAAYVMDNLMHLMGLHGKSFLPLFLGFGCNVPAVMGTRVIDSWPARLLTILIAPLVPCTARMAVVAFIAPIFFGANAVWVSWGLVLLSLVALVASGALLNRVIFKGQRSAFIMEMPLYHIPNLADDRSAGLAALCVFRQEGRDGHPGDVAAGVGAFYLPNGDLNTSYPGALWASHRTGRPVDGPGLAVDGGADHQFPRQGERHRHAGRAVRQFCGCRADRTAGGSLFDRLSPFVPGGDDALHPLHGDRGRDEAGNQLLALDAAERVDAAGAFGGRRHGSLSPGRFDWIIADA